jgi:hypothetical protein
VKRLVAAPLGALALAGCGNAPHDLFVVERGGTIPGAGLTLRVGHGGSVRCNDLPEGRIGDRALLEARIAAEELAPVLERGETYPARPGSVLNYRVIGEQGTVSFADTSRGLPQVLNEVAALTRRIAIDTCGLDR